MDQVASPRRISIAGPADPRRERAPRGAPERWRPSSLGMLHAVLLMLPIYWLLKMSLKSNVEITVRPDPLAAPSDARALRARSSPIPPGMAGSCTRSATCVINTIISVTIALPAAYAFNRYRFLGDKHLFFWLLSNLMAPPAVYAMPFFNLYSAVGLFDTVWAVALAHCLFNVPLAVWILEGFIAGRAARDRRDGGARRLLLPALLRQIFMPLIANGIGVTAFFCFMFSWVEQLLATTLTTVNAKPIVSVMTRTYSSAGMDWGLLAAAGMLTMVPGRDRDLVRAQPHRQGLRPGPRLRGTGLLAWMAWTWQTAIFFGFIALCLVVLTSLAVSTAGNAATRRSSAFRPRAATASSSRCIGDRLHLHRCGSGSELDDVLWWPLASAAALRRRDLPLRLRQSSRPARVRSRGRQGRRQTHEKTRRDQGRGGDRRRRRRAAPRAAEPRPADGCGQEMGRQRVPALDAVQGRSRWRRWSGSSTPPSRSRACRSAPPRKS